MNGEEKSTREIANELLDIDRGSKLKVILIDVADIKNSYLYDDRFASARKLFSLNDLVHDVFDYDQLFETTQSHVGNVPKETIEDAFQEALEFADSIQASGGDALKHRLQSGNGYTVGGISQRGQLVVGIFE